MINSLPFAPNASTAAPWCSLYRLQVARLDFFQGSVEFRASREAKLFSAFNEANFLSRHHRWGLKPPHRLASIEPLDINLIVLPLSLFINLSIYRIIDLLHCQTILIDHIHTPHLQIPNVKDRLLYYSFLLYDDSVDSFCLLEDLVLLLVPF